MRGLLVMGIPYQHAPEVSIVTTDTCTGGLDGAAVFVPQGVEYGGGLVSIVRPLSGYNPTLATARWPECWRTRNDVLAW